MALNFPNSPTLNQVYTDSTSGFSYQWNGTVWISFSAASSSQIKTLDDISASFNNSTQTFALTSGSVSITPPTSQSLIINLGGVIQDATDDYSVSGSNITFSTAPTNGLSFSGISLGPAVPVDYANNGNVYTRTTFTATASQTTFTVTGTYTVGYLDVYQNGVRLSAGTDYTATTGTTFVLTTPANLNDEIESIGYKVASIVTTTGQFDNLIISGVSTFIGFATHTGTIFGNNLSLTGIATASSVIVGSAVTINSSGINVTGIATIKNASGTVTIGIGTTALLVEGNARVTGILTVGSSSITLNGSTNIINVGTGLTLSSGGINVTGVITATSFVGSGSGLTGVGIGTNGSVNTSGIITATSFFGSGSGLTGVGIGTNGSVNTTGIITASSFVGNGSGLTGVGPSSQNVTSVAGITTINLSLGSVIYFTHNTNTTVAFANTSTTQEITFIRAKDNTSTARTITWPSSLRWNNIVLSTGAGPTLSNTSKDNSAQTFSLITRNSGINWYGWEESLYPGDNLVLFSWGLNTQGQLGQSNTTQFSSPVQVPGTTWSAISAGADYSLAKKTDGTLWAWGQGGSGRLGLNDATSRQSPVQIPGTSWSSISAGYLHSLATKTDGTLWSWGYGGRGALGQNTTTNVSSPIQIPGTTWSAISAGSDISGSGVQSHSLATKTDNTLWSWGGGSFGRLGQNTTTGVSSPVQIPGTTWSSISAGGQHSLATQTDGTLWAWGRQHRGQLGQNNVTYFSSPVQIPGTTWSAISAGEQHSLAKKTEGTLYAWGNNNAGDLGQNNNTSYFSSPIQIPGTTWSSIDAGNQHSLATKTDNTLWAWGAGDNGKLGQNATTRFSSPVQIPGTTWSSISAGNFHSLALG